MVKLKLVVIVFILITIPASSQDIIDTIFSNQQTQLFSKYLNLSRDEQFQLEERKLFSQKAIEIAKELNNPKAMMEALSSNGYITAQEGHYVKAFEIFNDLLGISDSVGYNRKVDWRRKAYLNNVLGLIYKELGEYDKALALYYESLAICDSVNWVEGASTVLINIGVLYELTGNTKQAIDILNESKIIAESHGLTPRLFDIYINMMDIFIKTQSYDSALFSGQRALDIAIENNNPYDQAFVETGFGKLYSKQGSYSNAIKSLDKGILISIKHGFDEVQLESLIELAGVYRKMGKYTNADSVLFSAMEIDIRSRIPRLYIKLLLEKSMISSDKGDFQSAWEQHRRAVFLQDSISSSWENVKYSEIETLYHMKLQKQRNVVLEKNLSIKQLQVEQQKFFMFISVGFLLVLTWLVILFYRKRRFEHKTNLLLREQNEKIKNQEKIIRLKNEEGFRQELDYKNRQLTAFSLSALKQSQSLDIVFQQINDLLNKQNIKHETRGKLEQVIKHLRPLNSQKEWDEFRSYFEAVHPSFYTSLKKIAPDLTLHEQKICAYLRLGMTTKEIATISFRQVRSVESSRFRIRKKLGLTANDNLFDYMEKL
jgi:tetratricopeptide (TPR) repeat protein